MTADARSRARDIHLTLAPSETGAGCRVRLSVGEETIVAAVPRIDVEGLERCILRPLRAHAERPVAPELLEALGDALAEQLFPPPVAARLRSELDRCAGSGTALRLRLAVDDPALAALPWEYLR